jgi:protein TonB
VNVSKFRFPIAFFLSLVFTTGIFAFMRFVTSSRGEVGEQAAITKFEFVRLKRSENVEEKVREKPKIEKPEQELVQPTLSIAQEDAKSEALDVQALAKGLGQEFGSAGGGGGTGRRGGMSGPGFSSGLADRGAIPLVRVEPQYPPQAQRQKLEGWVVVGFTITTGGSTKDIVVLQSSHSVFEKAAVQAVAKWKYQPQMEAGKPVEVPNQKMKLGFKLGEG